MRFVFRWIFFTIFGGLFSAFFFELIAGNNAPEFMLAAGEKFLQANPVIYNDEQSMSWFEPYAVLFISGAFFANALLGTYWGIRVTVDLLRNFTTIDALLTLFFWGLSFLAGWLSYNLYMFASALLYLRAA